MMRQEHSRIDQKTKPRRFDWAADLTINLVKPSTRHGSPHSTGDDMPSPRFYPVICAGQPSVWIHSSTSQMMIRPFVPPTATVSPSGANATDKIGPRFQ